MMRCIELARRAEGRTSPNPIVGAVVLDSQGEVVGEGFHERYGEPHAEVHALEQAGERASGGTLYASLEPCSHFGKTPPCVDRIIASGIKQVFAAITDPNPKVSGAGFKKLEAAGIEVVSGICIEDSNWVNRGFIKRMRAGLPWVCLKMASTLDGKIADRHGESKWITGEPARQYVHELRNRFDCVMIGGTTARADNPQLNVRDIPHARDPTRVVIDSRQCSPSDLRIFSKEFGSKAIVFCQTDLYSERRASYPEHVEVVAVEGRAGDLDMREALAYLAKHGCNTVLCEGGGRLAASLLKADLVDELNWLIAPKVLADAMAVPVIGGFEESPLKRAVLLHKLNTQYVGEDLLIRALTSSNAMSRKLV
jgi:diaminohydroxyphosphoribosylaminopyrimidine deaminase / 5-amino-6-(5-phosphoribosylamino)uracil reductase